MAAVRKASFACDFVDQMRPNTSVEVTGTSTSTRAVSTTISTKFIPVVTRGEVIRRNEVIRPLCIVMFTLLTRLSPSTPPTRE